MSTVVLYVRIPANLKAELDYFAREYELTLAKTAEIVLSVGLSTSPLGPERSLRNVLITRQKAAGS